MDKLVLYKISKMYYFDGLGQQEIANVTGYSRSQVSRMLKEARKCKIVDIKLNSPLLADSEDLSEKLRTVLSIESASIVDTSSYKKKDVSKRRDVLASYAAEQLSLLIPAYKKVGVGWGRTIYSVVLATEYSMDPTETIFVPLTGNAGLVDPYFQTNSIVDRFAEKYKAKGEYINSPGFVFAEDVRRYLIERNGLDQPGGIWDNIDLAFFSLGGASETNFIYHEIRDHSHSDQYPAPLPVGDCLGYFFDSGGDFIDQGSEIHQLSIPAEQFYDIPKRICISLGSEKVSAIKTASSMGLFTDIITDRYTAEELIG